MMSVQQEPDNMNSRTLQEIEESVEKAFQQIVEKNGRAKRPRDGSSRSNSHFFFPGSGPIPVLPPLNGSSRSNSKFSSPILKKRKQEVVSLTANELNNLTRMQIVQELEIVEEKDKDILAEKKDLRTRFEKEMENLDDKITKNKRKRSDLERALQSRMKFARIPKTPECPICLEEMRPPTQIFNCNNGHLVCGECRPKVINDMCTTCRTVKYMGRATAVEQMISEMFTDSDSERNIVF